MQNEKLDADCNIDSLQAEIEILKEDKNTVDEQLQQSDRDKEELQAQNKKLKSKIEKMEKKLIKAGKEAANIKRDIGKMEGARSDRTESMSHSLSEESEYRSDALSSKSIKGHGDECSKCNETIQQQELCKYK